LEEVDSLNLSGGELEAELLTENDVDVDGADTLDMDDEKDAADGEDDRDGVMDELESETRIPDDESCFLKVGDGERVGERERILERRSKPDVALVMRVMEGLGSGLMNGLNSLRALNRRGSTFTAPPVAPVVASLLANGDEVFPLVFFGVVSMPNLRESSSNIGLLSLLTVLALIPPGLLVLPLFGAELGLGLVLGRGLVPPTDLSKQSSQHG
jgi:hypothetical protein